MFSHLLRHPAQKQKADSYCGASQIYNILTYLYTYSPGTHKGLVTEKLLLD